MMSGHKGERYSLCSASPKTLSKLWVPDGISEFSKDYANALYIHRCSVVASCSLSSCRYAPTDVSSAHVNVPDASYPLLVWGRPGTPAAAAHIEQPAQTFPSTVHHVASSKMGYRQAAVLTSVSFFLGTCSATYSRPLSLTCLCLPCLCVFLRGALHLPKRRLPDPVHAAHGICRARWTGVLHHVLQLPARYQGEYPCFTSGRTSRSLALRSPARLLPPAPTPTNVLKTQGLLHSIVGVGLLGLLGKLHKWDDSAMFFDGSSLGAYLLPHTPSRLACPRVSPSLESTRTAFNRVCMGVLTRAARSSPPAAYIFSLAVYMTVGIPACRTVADPLPDVDSQEDRVEALRILSAGNTIIIVLLGAILALQASRVFFIHGPSGTPPDRALPVNL